MLAQNAINQAGIKKEYKNTCWLDITRNPVQRQDQGQSVG
jgi:hypothetical protein